MTSTYKRLYNALKSVLPDTYKTSFTYIDETKIVDGKTVPTTKACAIYFKGAFNGKRVVNDGSYIMESARVIFNIYGDKTVAGIEECLAYCDSIVQILDGTYNYEYTDDESGLKVKLVNLVRQGNINEVGRNSQGIPVYSINYLLYYN
jgi:hypothetical protein